MFILKKRPTVTGTTKRRIPLSLPRLGVAKIAADAKFSGYVRAFLAGASRDAKDKYEITHLEVAAPADRPLSLRHARK